MTFVLGTFLLAILVVVGITETITREGPFLIFDRLRIAISGIPKPLWPHPPQGGSDIKIWSEYEELLEEYERLDSHREVLLELVEFKLSLRGTIYGILDCRYCLAPYAAALVLPLVTTPLWGIILVPEIGLLNLLVIPIKIISAWLVLIGGHALFIR